MTTLNAKSTVAQWVAAYPSTAHVFEQFQIDYCCGGGISLGEACGQKQLDALNIVEQLTQVIANPPQDSAQNWLNAPLTELCDHIEATHHAYLREELPRLTGLVDKVAKAHVSKHPQLADLQQSFAELRSELEPHMLKEEQILFPAIRHLEHAASLPSFPFGTVANPIRIMQHEHDTAGNALARIRQLTNDFTPPEDACNTFLVMLDSLQRLEVDLHQHIHKENFILFPRAEELEASLGTHA